MVNDTLKRVNDLIDRAERNIAAVFQAAIFALRKELDLEAFAALLERDDLEGALKLLINTAEKLGTASTVVFIGAAESTADFLTNAGVGQINFDRVNVRAVQAMRQNQLSLIAEFLDSQRETLRGVMTDGIARGLPPIEQARKFREAVGLTAKQSQYVANYRAQLESIGRVDGSRSKLSGVLDRALRDKRSDAAVLRAIDRGRPLPQKQIDSMVERYHKRWVSYRAVTIARTEALSSVHQGNDAAFDQAIESGVVDINELIGTWHATPGNRTRDSHAEINGQQRKRGQTWAVRQGVLRYPGDPQAAASERIQCRCAVTWRIVPLAAQK